MDTSREEAKLETIERTSAVFKEVIDKSVKADELLAKVPVDDARNTPLQDPSPKR